MAEFNRLPRSQADLDAIERRLGDLRKTARSAAPEEHARLAQNIEWIEFMLPTYRSLVRLLEAIGVDRTS